MTEKRGQQASRDVDSSVFVIHSSMKLEDIKDFFTVNRDTIRAVYIHTRYNDDMKPILKEVKRCPRLERLKFLDTDVGVKGKAALETYLLQFLDLKPRLKYIEFESRDRRKFPYTPEESKFRLAIKRQGHTIVEVGVEPGVDRIIKSITHQ